MNRLGIFVFYDRDGIVDTYVEYLLATLKKHLGKLAVVCNGNLSCEGMERLDMQIVSILGRIPVMTPWHISWP